MWQAIKNQYHLINAILANIWYGFPGKKITVIGVTGTDGKTTTTNLIYHILKTSGKKVSMVSTIGAEIGKKTYDTGFHVTTPSSFSLQKYLRRALNDGMEYFVLEITSHGLDQNRAFGIPFKIGVITNITQDHFDYHKTYERYVAAKAKLLKKSEIVIVNKDDKSYDYLVSFKKQRSSQSFVTYGLQKNADVTKNNFPFITPLMGEFNTYNCLAAITVTKKLGLSDQEIRNGLKTFPTPIGRQEVVYNKEFRVMIDFAHTPNAIEQILIALKKDTKGRIIHVFGSAGERDVSKRPEMGKKTAKYADIIILTAEDPRSESIEKINNDIMKEIDDREKRIKNKLLLMIPDRKEAIEAAITLAKRNDTVVITGKGHEQSINLGKGEIPWSDHEAVKEALRKKK